MDAKHCEVEAIDRELAKLGRHDLIERMSVDMKQRVGTIDEPPAYYAEGIEPVKYIESHGMDFVEGSIIKYVTRYKRKGSVTHNPNQAVEDLNKARLYIDMLLRRYED